MLISAHREKITLTIHTQSWAVNKLLPLRKEILELLWIVL